MTQLKGLVFDMDGTLVDNLAYHFLAFDEYAKRKGFTLSEPLSLKHNGMHSDEIFKILVGESIVAEYGAERLCREKEAVYREIYRPNVKPVAGIVELLQKAKQAGLRCAIGSAGCRENVEFIVEALGIEDCIDVSISGSDVTHGKPHPEIFSKAVERLGLNPDECIVFEDAINGIISGIAAGCKCVGITTTASAEELTKAGAMVCAADFTALTIDDMKQLVK
ncbi:MAG: HAD family phosphatase [Rikenellaceae bacterium]|nr:HAD family phosphatase [Rikenellaceae bacterium]